MSLLQLKNATLIFGHPPLIDGVDLVVQAGERLCLVGRNGCGKSTLLKVIAAELTLDDGQRLLSPGLKIARLEQDPPMREDQSVFDFVAAGMAEVGQTLSAYFAQTQQVAVDPSAKALDKLQQLQTQLDHLDAWQYEQSIAQVLSQLELNGEQKLSQLSGGWRRKAALARALAGKPDLLLLDEPTNHLDVDMIAWLENTLLNFKGALVFVSHDRAFIRRLATRIVDLDRGKLTSYPGNYAAYLAKKAEDLAIEASQNQLFDKKLSEEEKWIRQGIKARRTRNEGRVRGLKALRKEHAERQKVIGSAKASLSEAERSGKMVFEAKQISYAYEKHALVKALDLLVMRGDKLALVGANGCGKSTLIKLLLGELVPQSGSLRQGANLQIAYFDQHRDALDGEKSLIDTVADGKREIEQNGNSRHVISYLQDYLFSPQRMQVPVKALSGGEKNRLLLAKILAKPSNLLILDEPTNDLDIETLELLEDVLSRYQGTVLLVSHDREFVDNVATQCLFAEGEGQWREFVGGFSDVIRWYGQHKPTVKPVLESKVTQAEVTQIDKQTSTKGAKKLSYKLQRELDNLPQHIEQLETQVEQLEQQIASPDFFTQDSALTNEVLKQLAENQQTLESSYARWEELDEMQKI